MTVTKYRKEFPKGNGQPVLVDGVRTPFVKSFGVFEDCSSLELVSRVVDGLKRKISWDLEETDEIQFGTVIPQTQNFNVARDTITNLGLPAHIHGFTLNRACTSSLQSVANAAAEIKFGHPNIVIAGGVEILSDVPIVYSKEARKFLVKLSKSKSPAAKLHLLKKFSAKDWLPRPPALTEPMTGLSMGEHTEIMARKNEISREAQDEFALQSHRKAARAQEQGCFDEEVIPVWPAPRYDSCVERDNIIRADSSMESLAKLRPAFDKKYGSLTAGNSSPLTDGASVALIGDEGRVRALGLKPKLRIVDYYFVGVDPQDQLLIGPAIAIPKILQRNGLGINDIDRFEIHEAFAAQVLSCIRSMESAEFCESYFGTSKAFGAIPEDKLNVNGGAIAIGHPFGATGTRMLVSLANELHRSDKERGLIAICAAGGMAGAMIVERI